MISKNGFDDEQVVFEHFESYHYYLIGSYKPNTCEGMVYYYNDDSLVVHACELKKDLTRISKLVKKEPGKSVSVKYLSLRQAEKYDDQLRKIGFVRKTRSENEVYYDVETMVSLVGSKFSKIRNKKRNIQRTPFDYEDITSDNIDDVIFINRLWRNNNKAVYEIDRSSNEESLIRHYCDMNVFCGFVQYFNGLPTGFCLLDISRDVLIQVITRGINNSSGHKYASTALYLKAFDVANERGFKLINDGDLGKELGTRDHKLSFCPISTAKTFDYILGEC